MVCDWSCITGRILCQMALLFGSLQGARKDNRGLPGMLALRDSLFSRLRARICDLSDCRHFVTEDPPQRFHRPGRLNAADRTLGLAALQV